ncbi:fructose-1,6-bisphosphate aldolase [Mageeibacillus indolicus UPII9-5]|uniref:fructose-bisphosphate aldolase n=1 Tax=Mageeibacillus indolicus (strain UPII9-5) TaxID=699246 RepID=D3R0R7_MAGIU|nr:fructose bisphosphate aldolase [Mageeibacillus indolicus]ADC91642.1 fructose-1,6-bisphosphate aldolase [Mageeibacillus indolicus UPII9-5]
MNNKQLSQMHEAKGFIAALDQSGGSTPKALAAYGVSSDAYKNDAEMFDMVHAMRTRIIKAKAFNNSKIIGAILFEQTMDREIDGLPTATYLWEKKGVVPFLKVDKGLMPEENGVQMLKPIPGLVDLLKRAAKYPVFGTKMRSVIKSANTEGIKNIVAQQFDLAKVIIEQGFVPIIEPEVDIHAADKVKCEELLKAELIEQANKLPKDAYIIFKLSIPTKENFYADLIKLPNVVRVVALSGGYERDEANKLLAKNKGVIASFSRALAEGLSYQQTDAEFEKTLADSVESIYQASID